MFGHTKFIFDASSDRGRKSTTLEYFRATAIPATMQAIQALPLKVIYARNRKAKIGKVLQEQIRTAKADEGSQARGTH